MVTASTATSPKLLLPRTPLNRTVSSTPALSNISAGELSAVLEERISNYGKEATASVDEIGKVFSVGDGIARVYGLNKVMAGELIEFADCGDEEGQTKCSQDLLIQSNEACRVDQGYDS